MPERHTGRACLAVSGQSCGQSLTNYTAPNSRAEVHKLCPIVKANARTCVQPAGLEITHIALQNGSPSGAPVTYFFKVPRMPGLGLSATKGASAAC